jgi:hypothetical protein
MRVYTYSEARQRLAEVLKNARDDEVLIKRKNGETFSVRLRKPQRSSLDIPGVDTQATMDDILEAIRDSRTPKQLREDAE